MQPLYLIPSSFEFDLSEPTFNYLCSKLYSLNACHFLDREDKIDILFFSEFTLAFVILFTLGSGITL